MPRKARNVRFETDHYKRQPWRASYPIGVMQAAPPYALVPAGILKSRQVVEQWLIDRGNVIDRDSFRAAWSDFLLASQSNSAKRQQT